MLVNFPISFWIVLILFVAHQGLQYGVGLPIPYVDSYFDPFACAVLGLSVFRWERQYLWQADQEKLGMGETIIVTIVLAIISEQLFPVLSDRFYNDRMDYVAFAVGGVYFYWIVNDNH